MIEFELVEQIAKTDLGPIYSLCVQSAMSSASHNDLFGCLHCRLCCLIIMTMMTNDADILIALFHNLLLDLKYKLSVSTSLLWFAGLMTHTQKQNSKSVGFCLSLHSHHFKASKKLVEKRRVGLNKIHWTMIFAGERF